MEMNRRFSDKPRRDLLVNAALFAASLIALTIMVAIAII